jgi:hypothetical protein
MQQVTVIVRGTDAANRLVGALSGTTCKVTTPRSELKNKPAARWLFRVTGTTRSSFEDVLTHDVIRANMVCMQYIS